MLKRTVIVVISGLLGAGTAFAAGSCGEDRGGVKVEGGTGTTSSPGGTTGTTEESGTTATTP